ncbi:MAG: hypothetical protein IKN96_05255 [Oscillibacter sp.]|nr:hypothetical protein [Oscillibacter sp.]
MERLQDILQKARIAAGRFMLGRNGMDELNYALLWAYLALCVVRAVIVWLTRSAIAGGVFDVIADIAAIAMLYRVLSRNLPKRQGENLRFLNWRKRAQRLTEGAIRRHKDKAHKYYACKQCGTICRVPTGKGNIVITCPKCGAKIQAKT